MPFWKRDRAVLEASELDLARHAFAVAAEAGQQPCSEAGCPREDAVLCSYMDRRGRRCGTAVCPEHGQVVDGQVHCQVHADTVRAVGQVTGDSTLRPDVDNPAPLLVSWVARDLHDRLREMLDASVAPTSTEHVLVDENVSSVRAFDGSRRWEQAWKIVSHTGVVLKVTVQAEEARPTEVVVRVGPQVVAQFEPPWFLRFRRGERLPSEEAAAERLAVYEPVYRSLGAAIKEQRSAGVRGPY